MEIAPSKMPIGVPTSVVALPPNRVNKLQEGSDLPVGTSRVLLFREYIETWGGTWMWEDIDDSQATKGDTSWITEGLKAGSLIWAMDGSYNRNERQTFLSWDGLYFAKRPVFGWQGHSGKNLQLRAHSAWRCLGYAHFIFLCALSRNITLSAHGQRSSPVTTNGLLNYHCIIKREYDQAQNAQISGGNSVPPSRLTRALSLMYTFTATWTTIYHWLNWASCSSSTAFATC
jgi:hypothetical protein